MTREQWQNRIYDGKDLNIVRIQVTIQFLLSLLGLLTVFMFPINLFTVLTNAWIFKIKRLPPDLKILTYSGTIISGIWFLMLGLLIVSKIVK